MKTSNSENKIFGNRLRQLRIARNISVQQVASFIGVAESTYREWENGRAISGQPYLRITEVFGISLNALFNIENERRSEIYLHLDRIEEAMKVIKKIL